MSHTVKLSVRQLVEFVMRSGSIDSRYTGLSIERANEGSRIHRKLQKEAGKYYNTEVKLSYETMYHEIIYQIQGRADGIIVKDKNAIIDEIKTTAAPLESIDEEFSRLHWAQAKCYGFFYCMQNEIDSISIQLTYYNIDTEDIRRLRKDFTKDELKDFFENLLAQYQIWAEYSIQWNEKRNCSIRQLSFPFLQYRKGQRALAAAVYRTILAEGKLYGQAPTGIGKTISTLFPAVKAIGEEKIEKIFYLTAKTITRQAAEKALVSLREKGLCIKSITLTAKDKICFLEERICTPETCPYADGHFDRINQAMFQSLQIYDDFSKEIIEEIGKKYEICPFELALDLSLWCDCIICDYNYVFDPQVYLRRFFGETKGEYVFLIDEAHNLVDRSREMFSAELKKSVFSAVKKEIDVKEKNLHSAFTKLNTAMVVMRKQCGEIGFLVQKEKYDSFLTLLYHFVTVCELYLENHKNEKVSGDFLILYFNVISYLRVAEQYDTHYITYISTHKQDVWIRQLCLDPSQLLYDALNRGKSAVLFSATLTPLEYFLSILGGDEASKRIMLPSPFRQKNMGLYIADYISTRYKDRDKSYMPIADLIMKIIQSKNGNYIVFFPSYQYMNQVYTIFAEKYSQIQTLIQQGTMNESEREWFLNQFDFHNQETLLGFCVLGGIFSEGIDLKGERLIGTIIIGVGLPQLSTEQNVIKDYYNEVNGQGYAYAYTYPGMNKILQAAGRVIRDADEKGIVVLVDDRYATKEYQNLFPLHWAHYEIYHSQKLLSEAVEQFWKK